jgi:hypothetical protein
MAKDVLFKVWLLAFRALSLGCLVLGSLGAVSFLLFAFMPGQSLGMNIFAAVMAALIAVVGKRGLSVRSRDDLHQQEVALGERRDRFERWINRE